MKTTRWKEDNNKLERTITLKNFMDCVNKINEIAKIAEEQDHHPNLCIEGYKNLKIEIFTHDENKITEKDIRLAEAIDKLL
jgi:4a-hydroxytetrahydrobiopterin dehydratase